MKQSHRLRDAEKDLCFALGKLQSGNRLAAYLNTAIALVHIAESMNESEHQQALIETSHLVASTP